VVTGGAPCRLAAMLILAGTLRIAAGQRAAALGAIIDMVKATRAEPGCIEYSFAFDVQDDHLLHLFEAFADDAALVAHRASTHMARWRALMPELGIGGRDMNEYQVASSRKI
jgi:quinol monooxygenase YgiN